MKVMVKMAYEWAKSNYSGKAVKKAGESLIKADAGALERVNALQVLSDWRASHAYPLHAILILLRKQSNIVDKGAIVVRRLKRTPSIVSKLTRYPNMKLHRMQDIGGCRSIVSSVKHVEKLLDNLKKSSTSHVIHKVKNYIDEPKDTGYRGVHVIYKYNASKQEFKDYFIEIQLRSKIQHAWATAVEIIDTYTKQALKSNQGDAEWRQFFVYASAEFAKLEGRKIGIHVEGIDTKNELKDFLEKLNVLSKLDAFSESSKFIFSSEKKEFDYFLLDMKHTLTSAVVTVRGYKVAQLREATDKYLELEKESTKDSLHDVVLVSARSLKELKKAYPNYSADSKEFIKYIKQVLL